MSKDTFYEALGWYGFIGLLAAYAVVALGFTSADNIWYQLLNLTGAVGMAGVSFYKKTYQPGVLNLVWAMIAGIALAKSSI